MLENLKDKINKFKEKNFVKDVATLQVGSIFSKGLSFIASIIFARMLGASQYGIYSLIFSFTALISVFMDWGVGYAALTIFAQAYTEKDRPQIVNVLTYFLKFSLIIYFTIGLLSIIFSPKISYFLYHNYKIGELSRLILLSMIIGMFFSLFTITLQVLRKIKYLTILENINKFFYALIPATLVLFGLGVAGIVWGNLIAALIFLIFSIISYSYLASKDELLPSFKELFLNFRKIKMGYYIKFGFLIAIDKNIASFYTLLPITFLGMFVLPREVAFFKIAFSYITLSSILLSPISRLLMVQLPKSRSYGLDIFKRDFLKVSLYSGMISVLLVIPFIILGPFLVNLFYGQEFRPVIPLIYYLSIYSALLGFGVGVGPIFRTLNKMRVVVKVNILMTLIGIPLVFYLIRKFQLIGAVLAVDFWGTGAMLILLIYMFRYLDKRVAGEKL